MPGTYYLPFSILTTKKTWYHASTDQADPKYLKRQSTCLVLPRVFWQLYISCHMPDEWMNAKTFIWHGRLSISDTKDSIIMHRWYQNIDSATSITIRTTIAGDICVHVLTRFEVKRNNGNTVPPIGLVFDEWQKPSTLWHHSTQKVLFSLCRPEGPRLEYR